MDNYVKAEKEEFVPEIIIEGSKDDVTVMHVKSGSKTKNLIQFAEKKLASESSQIIWEGSGDAAHKTITCAEIMKKKFNHSLYQITRLATVTIVETWKPRLDGLDEIRVKRHLPFVKILLSKEPLATDANGYQAPEDVDGLFDRGPVGARPKYNNGNDKSQRRNRNKRRVKSTADDGNAKDETLLGDCDRRKEFEKKNKMERKKKKAAAPGGKEQQQQQQRQSETSKQKQDSVERDVDSVLRTNKSSDEIASVSNRSAVRPSSTSAEATEALTNLAPEKSVATDAEVPSVTSNGAPVSTRDDGRQNPENAD